MISKIYPKYFQKSALFLYPLLEFKKDKALRPVQTYLSWSDTHMLQERKLICLYKKNDSIEWSNFEKNKLVTHKMLDYCTELENQLIIYVFDLNCYAEDFETFLKGQYSQLSKEVKNLITTYHGIHNPEWAYVESFLYPEKHYKTYSELLNVDIVLLREVKELCEKYNEEKENLEHSQLILEQI